MAETAVVVGSDGGSIGAAVVRHGAVLAVASGSRLHIVASAEALGAAITSVEQDVEVAGHVAAGDLSAAVWEVAERVHADLIVIDRATRNPARRALRSLRRWLLPNARAPVELIDVSAARATLTAQRRRIASS